MSENLDLSLNISDRYTLLFDTSSVQFVCSHSDQLLFEMLVVEFNELRKNMETIADTLNSINYHKDETASFHCQLSYALSAEVPTGIPILHIYQTEIYPCSIELSMEEFSVLYKCNDVLLALSCLSI